MTVFQSVETSYTTEVIRKGIHLTSLLIPVVYFFLPKTTALTILLPLAALFGISDALRLLVPRVGEFYERIFGFLLRPHELQARGHRLNGATYVLLSAAVCMWIFPKIVFLTAFSILIISDTSAALVGRRYGRRPFLTKTRAGSSAFFVSALLVIALAPKVDYGLGEYLVGAAAAALGTVVEAAALPVDDNLSLPFVTGAVMWLLYAIVLPGVNVFALDVVR
jgi:dolichol kinase